LAQNDASLIELHGDDVNADECCRISNFLIVM